MPRNNNNKKVWNEDLVKALKARHQQAWQQQSESQYRWRDGAKIIEAVRKDIRLTSTGKIFNFPQQGLSKTVYEECVKIIKGEAPIYPPGYAPMSNRELEQMESSTFIPYLEKMKRRGGAYAIMMAFHVTGKDSMTKDEICGFAQQHCDEQMDANFHQGRTYGAWKSKDTLIRHEFLTEHKQGVSMTSRGFRSNGKHIYQISPIGKKAIEQMLQKWPDIASLRNQQQEDLPWSSPNTTSLFQNTGVSPITQARFRGAASPLRKINKKSPEDEEELRDWVSKSSVGSQKVFKIGKERRMYLHRLCETLQQEHPGLRLDSHSEGTGNARHLYITIRAKTNNNNDSIHTLHTITAAAKSASFTSTTELSSPSTKKRPHAALSPGSSGKLLGGRKGRKKIPASRAAAEAALARFDKKASAHSEKARVSCNPSRTAMVDLTTIVAEEKMATKPPKSCIGSSPYAAIDLASNTDIHYKQSASAARSPKQETIGYHRNPFDYQPGDTVMLLPENNNDNDLGPYPVVRVHTDGHVTIKRASGQEERIQVRCVRPYVEQNVSKVKSTPPEHNDKSSIIDLCEVDVVVSDTTDPVQRDSNFLTILIDNRERSRNHTPRELRIELSKELNNQGSFKLVLPTYIQCREVVEQKLCLGDFAFTVSPSPSSRIQHGSDDREKVLSLVVERKQVADLVQRSAKCDHWKQLQRMRDHCQHAIMLVENDTKFAGRFDAYGCQRLVDPNRPCHHTIENELDLFRFVGRGILLSSNIKFILTRDSRGTYRSIGALGLMASTSTDVARNDTSSKKPPPTAASEQQHLQDRLTSGGIDWKIAREIAKEVGSVTALQHLYDACSSLKAKKYMIQVILENCQESCQPLGRLDMWSEAIYCVFSTASSETRKKKRNSYQDIIIGPLGSCCDPGTLLHCIYTEPSIDEAVDKAMDYPPCQSSPKRRVSIELSKTVTPCFEKPTDESFYTLKVLEDDNPWSAPTVQMSTHSSISLKSDHMTFFVLDGKRVLDDVLYMMNQVTQNSNNNDYVTGAKNVANTLKNRCTPTSNKADRHIILVQGLGAALDAAAKSSSYQDCTKVVLEMVFAWLMMEHNMVVLQARNDPELQKMLQQFALSCYYYQLLTHDDEDAL